MATTGFQDYASLADPASAVIEKTKSFTTMCNGMVDSKSGEGKPEGTTEIDLKEKSSFGGDRNRLSGLAEATFDSKIPKMGVTTKPVILEEESRTELQKVRAKEEADNKAKGEDEASLEGLAEAPFVGNITDTKATIVLEEKRCTDFQDGRIEEFDDDKGKKEDTPDDDSSAGNISIKSDAAVYGPDTIYRESLMKTNSSIKTDVVAKDNESTKENDSIQVILNLQEDAISVKSDAAAEDNDSDPAPATINIQKENISGKTDGDAVKSDNAIKSDDAIKSVLDKQEETVVFEEKERVEEEGIQATSTDTLSVEQDKITFATFMALAIKKTLELVYSASVALVSKKETIKHFAIVLGFTIVFVKLGLY